MLIGKIAVDLVDRELALSLMVDSLSTNVPLAVVSANLQHIHHFADECKWSSARYDMSATDVVTDMRWLTLLDGVPLVRKANSLSGRRWQKLSGSDLIEDVLEALAPLGGRLGVLGGEVATHHLLRDIVGQRFPAIQIVGTWAPTPSQIADAATCERIANEIRASGVQVLIVALGKPRQEEWIARFGPTTGAHLFLAFGAAIDFLTQRVRRAPAVVRSDSLRFGSTLTERTRRGNRAGPADRFHADAV